jgi:hypothetical protein
MTEPTRPRVGADVPGTVADGTPAPGMPGHERLWRAPDRPNWWIATLFALGSVCFLVAPFPGFVQHFGSGVDGMVYFVGSVLFTLAAAIQCIVTFNSDPALSGGRRRPFRLVAFEPRRTEWWSAVVQFAGTVYFNLNTFRAMTTGFDNTEYNRLVWTPDTLGCICFLIASYLAYVEVAGGLTRWPRHRTVEWKISAVNLAGSVAFGISAIASFVVPATGSVLDLAAANVFIALGALGFLIGSLLMLSEPAVPTDPAAP